MRSCAHRCDLPERYGKWKLPRACSKVGTLKPYFPTKAYDGNDLRARITTMEAAAVIPSRHDRKVAIPHDTAICKHRNQIERCYGPLKHFRHFATRYDRPTIHFTGFVHIAAEMIWLQ